MFRESSQGSPRRASCFGKKSAKKKSDSIGATLGFEAKLWLTADKLCNNTDADEYKHGGQFYTPRCVVRVLVETLAPYKGRVYDPCCGSAGFCKSAKTIEVAEHGYVLTPDRYVGAEKVEDDDAPLAGIRCADTPLDPRDTSHADFSCSRRSSVAKGAT